jgi:uncharacterized membrane protein YGL010W
MEMPTQTGPKKMKTLEQQLAAYLRYHRDARNKLTHLFGVPLIIFALLIPMSRLGVDVAGVRITLAHAFLLLVLGYYFLLDVPLAVALTIAAAGLLRAAQWIAGLDAAAGWLVCAGAFAGGWVLQLLGHYYEGRRPALLDNVWQIFVAPLFVMAEVFAKLGWKRDVLRRAERKDGR